MRKIFRNSLLFAAGLLIFQASFAGNEDRVGQAGATELLINPWARSSGWGGSNSASIQGLESMFWNVAGTAFTRKTEVMFANTQYLVNSGISLNAFGLTQKVGEAGVLGLGVVAMNFGDIDITTTELPEGNIGTFRPQYMNIGVSYAKIFSNRIYGGITIKVISESISNLSAMGVCFDAGIQYVTSIGDRSKERNKDNLHFGIALKNVGPPMKFGEDGLSVRGSLGTGASLTVDQRAAKFELPSLLNIGVTYHYRPNENHKISVAGTFTSNSFSKDQFRLGLEYAFKKYFMLRGGYVYEKDLFDSAKRTTVYTGPTAGVTVEIPFGESSSIDLDYSYREFQRLHQP